MKKKKQTILSVLQTIAKELKGIRVELETKNYEVGISVDQIKTVPFSEYFTITERPDLKTSDIMNLMRSKFQVYSYYNDEQLDKEFPAPKVATTRKFKKTVEPDAETLGKSTLEADPEKKGITLRERMFMELAYFEETGKHLDIKGVTFCSGSRYSDGIVPCMYWDSDFQKVYVSWGYLSNSVSYSGIRREV